MAGRGSVQGSAGGPDLSVAGWVPINMLDWEGRLVTTVFVAGCNFSCPFCHNPELVSTLTHPATIPFSQVEQHVMAKASWLDGVVLSGGEPTLHPHVMSLARRIKALGVGLKLDTNGSKPDVLAEMLQEGLVDYVAMDVKTSLERYPLVARRPMSIQAIERSVNLIVDSGVRHEFRTTMVPTYVDRTDALQIAMTIAGGQSYVLQQFNPKITLDPAAHAIEPYSAGYLHSVAEECSRLVPTTVRGTG